MLRRRSLLAAGLLLAPPCALTLTGAPPARAQGTAWPRQVTDIAGRTVALARPPRKLLLATGFDLVALSLLQPDPVSLLAGWSDDLARINPPLAAAFTARFPRLAEVPRLGSSNQDSFSIERALSLAPDLAVLPLWQAGTPAGQGILRALEGAGIPCLVLDFNRDPLRNTAPSMRALGRALGQDAQGEGFAAFYEQRLRRIRDAVAASAAPGPRVMLHAFAGNESCCWVWSDAGLGSFLAELRARNLGAGLLPPGQGGMLHLEQVITEDPEVYITTGLPRNKFSIGPGITREAARASLRAVLQGPGLAGLSAIRHGRAHGVWNHFNAVPTNILALEAMARWVRPELFPDLDPGETLAEINRRFAALPFEGTLWVSLDPALP
ncbi:ABC transporter substrate-binding protein [Pseudoroseomonas cervicalis]|uniref:ABC transporter substrate-binding protein n=1 Tax=Teichococcus cervicalis TaxID=204525 RepID=UPI00278173F9|nr:ABC transporter substrate-binding protein [Pseudoroseomonas cervicalis]MDQ1081104.1 iron complex transport system substrate-binding protein [Pseudoroseomonas cervicalis]